MFKNEFFPIILNKYTMYTNFNETHLKHQDVLKKALQKEMVGCN